MCLLEDFEKSPIIFDNFNFLEKNYWIFKNNLARNFNFGTLGKLYNSSLHNLLVNHFSFHNALWLWILNFDCSLVIKSNLSFENAFAEDWFKTYDYSSFMNCFQIEANLLNMNELYLYNPVSILTHFHLSRFQKNSYYFELPSQ